MTLTKTKYSVDFKQEAVFKMTLTKAIKAAKDALRPFAEHYSAAFMAFKGNPIEIGNVCRGAVSSFDFKSAEQALAALPEPKTEEEIVKIIEDEMVEGQSAHDIIRALRDHDVLFVKE